MMAACGLAAYAFFLEYLWPGGRLHADGPGDCLVPGVYKALEAAMKFFIGLMFITVPVRRMLPMPGPYFGTLLPVSRMIVWLMSLVPDRRGRRQHYHHVLRLLDARAGWHSKERLMPCVLILPWPMD